MNAGFNIQPAVAMPTTVRYVIERGSANADDYRPGSGEVVVSEGATRGTIQIFIVDDGFIERPRDTFSLNLVDSDGYVLGSPTRIEISIREGVCDRTPQVAEAIRQSGGQSHCSDVSDTGSITQLSIINNPSLTTLKRGDFFYLNRLQRLELNDNGLTTLPAGVFIGVGNLTELRLDNNDLTTLPAGVFDTLGSLTELQLDNNGLTTLPEGVFDALGSLTQLRLDDNDLTTLPENVFDALGSLTQLQLDDNDLTTLPEGVFDDIGSLTELRLNGNDLTALPAGVFGNLGLLTELRLDGNDLTMLPEDVFDNLGSLTELRLNDNDLTTLPAGTFAGLPALRTLQFQNNQVATWPASILNGLNNLQTIDFGSNGITQLPDDIFADNNGLRNLLLGGNQLRELPEQVFFGLPQLRNLSVNGNRLTELPAGAFPGYEFLNRLRLSDNQLESLPPDLFSDLERANWLTFHNNRLTALPPGTFLGLTSNLRALSLGGNPGAPFQLKLRLEFAGEEQAPTLTDEPVVLRATLREGAPYALEIELQALSGTLSTTEVAIEAGSTWSGTFTVTRLQGENSVAVSFADVSSPPNRCFSFERRRGQCFSGLEIVSDAEFALDDQPLSAVSGVAITSAPISGDAYTAGNPNDEIVVELEFSGEIEVIQANDGSWPVLALEVGNETRFAAYDDAASSTDKMVFRYKPQDDDNDDDGISVLGEALRLNGARILDAGVPVSLDLGDHAIPNALDHKVKVQALSFEEPEIRLDEGETVNAVFNLSVAVAMPTTVRYTIEHGAVGAAGAADAADYEPGSGEVVVPAGETSGTIQIFIMDDELIERVRETFSLNLVDSDGYVLGSRPEIRVFIQEGVCDRTPQVAEAIRKNRNKPDCSGVNNPRFIRQLEIVDNPGLTTLKERDFFELNNLERLYLNDNGLTTLPEDVFDDIKDTLQQLRLNGNDLTTLPENVFDGLGSLTELRLNDNDLTTLPAGVFAELQALVTLRLQNNQLSELPASIFNGLSNLRLIGLESNGITQLPDDIFADNGNLRNLLLEVNQLRELPEQVFFGLTRLENLIVDHNQLTELPAGAFSGYRSLVSVRFSNNQLESLPPGLFSDLERVKWLRFHDNRLTALPPGVFSGPLSNLAALNLDRNPGSPFQLKLRLEFAGEEQAPTLTDEPVVLRATLREGAPYALAIGLQASHGTLSTTEVTIEAGSTWSGTFTVTRLQGENSVAVSFADVSPPTPPSNCANWQRRGGQCFSGLEIVSDAEFALGDQPLSAVSGVAIVSAPLSGDTYAAGVPNEEIIVDLEFSGEIDVVQANDGSWPSLALEVGDKTRFAAYDDAASSTDKMVFRYKPQDDDVDDDGISVLGEALHLDGARILDAGIPVSLDLGDHAIRNAPNHKVKVQALSFEESAIRLDEGSTVNAVFNFSIAVAMPTTVRYRLTPDTADAADYEAGSGEVVVPAGESSGTIQIFIVDDDIVERARDTFSLNLVDSDGYVLGSQTEIRVFIREGVCDRTPQVADVIRQSRRRAHCSDVNNPRFIERLTVVRNPGLTTLKRGDFFELDSLADLYLFNNRLTTLPEGVFDDIKNTLQRLRLDNNRLTTLPEGIFDNLGLLRELWLRHNELTTLPEGVFDNLGSVLRLALNNNRLTALPEGAFTGLSSLRVLQLHDNPGAPFRLTPGLEPVDKTQVLTRLLSANTPAMVELTLREGAPYPLTLALTASGVQLSADSVTIPAGSTRSVAFTMTRNMGEDRVRIDFSEPPPAPGNCVDNWKHEEQCFPGLEIAGAPTIYFVYDGGEPRVTAIQFASTPQNPDGYVEGEVIKVDVVFDRGLVTSPITEGSSSSPTLALQIGNNRRTAAYVVGSNAAAGILSFVYTVTAGDFDENGVSVAQDGLQLNGATVTEPVGDRPANVGLENRFLADFPEQKVRTALSISFTDSDNRIWGGEGEVARAAFSLDPAPTMPVTVRYTFDHDTADADDYEAGSGEIVVPADATGGTIEIPIVDDDDIEPLRERFYVNLVDSAGYRLGNQTRLEVLIAEGVCDRTPQIRDTIVELIPGVSDCAEVTDSHLSGITEKLALGEAFVGIIATLKAGDFSGLGNLKNLGFGLNHLSTLPVTVFSGLGNLKNLGLQANHLSTLPATVFSGLGNLNKLVLNRNQLTALPTTIFSGLVNLQDLRLQANQLTALPPGVFSDLANLERLLLHDNQLTTLPEGTFTGLSSLIALQLHDNPGTTFSLTLRLEPADEAANVNPERLTDLLSANTPARVKLTLREGAPYPLAFALTASGVELSTDSVTIPAGGTQSETFTTTRNMDENRVRITLSDPPSPPNDCQETWKHEGQCFTGFEIVYAGTEISIGEGICDRTPQVRDGIVRLVSGVSNCAEVTDDHLSEVTGVLDLSSTGIDTLSADDFSGLDGLNGLDLSSNRLSSLPLNVFSGLVELEAVWLSSNLLTTLPEGTFTGLSSLRSLQLHDNPGTTFRLTLGLELADEAPNVNPERLADLLSANTPAMAKLTLRESAPYRLTLALTASGVQLSTNQVTIPTGGTQSETFAMTRITGQNRVRVDVSEPPSPPTDCPEEEKHQGQCFTGFEIVGAPTIDFVYGSSISFEKSKIEAAEGETINAVFNVQPPVAMQTIVRYTLEFGTAVAADYRDVTGNGEVVVPESASSGTIRIFIVDDEHIEQPRDTFSLNLVDSDGYALGSPTRIEISIREGVCDRTPQVAEAIREELGEPHCSDVSDTRFITRLSIVNHSDLTALKARDLLHLDRLVDLYLFNNRLTMLPSPAGLFASVGNLRRLRLDGNRLTTLPADIFDVLGHLEELWLRHNELTMLPKDIFSKLGSVLRLPLNDNRLTALPEGTFEGLSSLRVLHLHDNPGAPFRLELGLEPADETANVNPERLADLLSANTPAMVKLTLRDGAPYPLTLALTASGVQLSADSVTIPAGSTQSMALTMTRNMDRVRIDFSEPPPAPSDCVESWKHEGQCFTGFEIVGAPTIYFVYDGGAPQVTTIRFISTPQDPNGYVGGETIRIDVVFDRGLVIPPVMEGSSSSPTLALQIGADQRTATYMAGSNASAGILSFVYVVRVGDLDENGVSVAPNGLQLNGVSVTEPVGDRPANVGVDGFLADFPEQKVRTFLSISFEESEIEPAEGATVNAVFNFSAPVAMPTTVRYTIEHGTADADDYEVGSGEVVVPADATSGTIRIFIVDDDFIERTRDTFSLNLVDSDGYALGSPTRIEISIREGVCDRTPQVRDGIVGAIGGVTDCANVDDDNLSGITGTLDLSSTGIATLRAALVGGNLPIGVLGDFSGLNRLNVLKLDGNELVTLPESIFSDLDGLVTLDLSRNQLVTLPGNMFEDHRRLVTLDLSHNQLETLAGNVFEDTQSLVTLDLSHNQLETLPRGVFSSVSFGLDSLRTLDLSNNRLTELPRLSLFVLETLDLSNNQLETLPDNLIIDNAIPANIRVTLKTLDLSNNRLTELPRLSLSVLKTLDLSSNQLTVLDANVFSSLDRLEVLKLDDNELSTLPADVFSGLGNLQSLNVSNNPGAPFVFARPRLEPTGTSPGPGVVEVKLVVDEALPTTMTASLSVDDGTLSVTEVVIPEGSNESAVFTVTQDAGAPMTLRASTGVLTDYVGVETASSELVLDVVGPSVSGVEIVSVPASGDAYRAAAGEVIRVGVGFNEAVETSTTIAGPWLTLTIGETTRAATYVPSSGDASTLVFAYALQAGDADADGISVEEDALVLAGAVITDLPGNPIENTSLASHVVSDAAGHRVIRTFRLRFGPSEAALAPGTSIVATLVLEGAEALGSEEEVSVELTASSGLELLTTSPVTMNSGASSRVAVRLKLLETAGPGNRLTASVLTSLPDAEFFSGVLEVVRGVELLLLDHAGQAVEMVPLVAGESTEITVATAPVLEGNERVTVTLSVAPGLTLEGVGSALIGGNALVLTSEADSTSATIRVGTSTPNLDLEMGISASGMGENVGVVGEAPSLGVATEVSDEVTVVLPSLPIAVQQGGRSTMLRVETDPRLGTGQAVTVRLTIEPDDAGLSFADGSFITDVSLGETEQSVDVEVIASAEAVVGSSARVTSTADASVGLDVIIDTRSEATLEVAVPRVVLGLRPAGGEIGEALSLGLGESKAVELSLTDFTLSGNQTATFEVSVSGGGLSLQGGTQVSLSAMDTTAGVTVTASDSAVSVGELSVRALSGVELSEEVQAATLPIGVLQSVSLAFDPDLVEIQRGRSTEFEVRTSEPLVADRMVTVTLTISDPGFAFDAGSTQHEVTFDAGKSSETVTVETTAAEGSMAQVSVAVIASSGVDLAPPPSLPPSLSLQATAPRVSVAFSPADELRLPSGGTASVTLGLADYSLAGNQAIVLGVSADDKGLTVSPPSVSLTATSPTATVQVSASRRVESGNLVVSAVSGAELVGGTQSLPVSVSPRQLAVSFEPSMVRLVRGGAAAETVSTEVSLSVAPALEGDEELVLELISGDGELEVSSPARLSSMVRAVPVRVTASLTTASTEVATSVDDADTSIGNAVVSFMPLTVEVVRGVALSLSDHAGQAVEMVTIVAGESTEITVATEPALEGDERVTVTLSVAAGLSVAGPGLIGGNVLVLTSAENSTSARVSVSTSTPGLDLEMGISASGVGENVGVVGEASSLDVATEFSGRVAVVFPPQPVEVQQGSSMTFRVETDPPLDEGQAVTVRLTIAPADAGLSFAGGSLFTDVSLGATRQSVDVSVFASPEAEIGSSARVTSMVLNASVGLGVTPDEATLGVTVPQVILGLTPAGGEIGEALSLGLGESRAVALSLTDFTPSGSQEAVFEVSVEGEGLTLEGGAKSIQVSFVAGENTKPISVTASDDAASVGRLVVRPVDGVELAGGVETTSLPIGVLQSVSLVFDPADVEIQRGRSTQFEVRTSEPLVADRMVTVTLTISDQGFSFFDAGSTQHEITFDAGKSRETVTVAATAAEGSMVQVAVVADATQGVDLAPPPSLNLQATLPPVPVLPRELMVSFEPGMVRLVRGGAAAEMASTEVRLSVAPALEGDEELVLELTSGDGKLEVSPLVATLTSEVRVVDVTVTAAPGTVSTEVVALEGSGTLIGNAEVSFTPLTVEVVRGVELVLLDHAGQAAEMVRLVAREPTEITVATSPTLVGDERVTVTLSVAEGLSVAGSRLIGGNVLVLTSAANSSARVRVGTSTPGLVGEISASGEGENIVVVGESPALGVISEVADEVTVVLPSVQIEVQQGRSTMLRVETDPSLGAGQSVAVRLTIAPADAGLSFAGGSLSTDVSLGETEQGVDVEVFASPDAAIGSNARVTSMVLGDPSVGLTVIIDTRSEATLVVAAPQVTLGLTPAGGEIGETLTLGLGENKAVELRLTDFTLSRSQTAEFEVSVSGGGLSLAGAAPSNPQLLQVTLDAVNVTAEVTVMASDSAVSAGELRVGMFRGVELASGAEATTLPIGVLQSVELVFDPDVVEIQRGRSTQFEVRMSEPLVADRKTTVTLTISDLGFAFDAGNTQHEITFDADKSSETVTVETTAAEGSMAQVSVEASTSSGVDLAPLPGLTLKATVPRVAVVFSPADELRLPSGGEASVTLSLADYSLAGDQAIVLDVSADDVGLRVSPSRVTLTATSPTATVQVSASRRAKSGNLVVSAASGAVLVGGTQSLPVSVSPRQLAVSFEPSMVRLVRGGAAAEMASTEVSLNVAPALESDERLALELTPGAGGNLDVSPLVATLRSMVRAVPVRVTASLTTVSTEVTTSVVDADTAIGNAEVSFMPLTVEVVRGVELSLSDHAGQAVTMVTIVAGDSTEITVATEPSLEGDERVTVTLDVAEGLSVAGSELIGGNVLVLTSAANSSARVSVSTSIPDLDLAMGISASGEGENVAVVGELPALRVVDRNCERSRGGAFSGASRSSAREQQHDASRGNLSAIGCMGQAVTVRLTIKPADAGLSFADGSPSTNVSLGETRAKR